MTEFRRAATAMDTPTPTPTDTPTATPTNTPEPPTVDSESPTRGALITALAFVQVTFTEPVTGLVAGNLTVNASAATNVTGSGAGPYTSSGYGGPDDGTVNIALASGAIQDSESNSFAGDNWTYDLDSTAPTVDSESPTRGALTNTLASVQVTFTEPVTGVVLGSLTVGGASATGIAGSGAGPYTFSGYTGLTDGTVNVVLAAGAIQDSMANAFLGDSWNYNLDTENPTVTVEQDVGQDDPTNELPITFSVVFNDPVTGFDQPSDVTMGGTAAGVTFGVSGSGTDYTITVTAAGDGTLVPTIGAGVCQDAAGNPNDASTSGDNSVTHDVSPPTILSGTLPPAPGNGYVDVSMSDPVYSTNTGAGPLDVSDFAVDFVRNGGDATGAIIASVTTTGGGALTGGEIAVRVNLTITGVPSGLETVAVRPANASSIFDFPGNAMLGGRTTGPLTLNDALPEIVGGALAGDNAYVDVTMSEGVFDTNGGAGAVQPADFALTFVQGIGTATAASIADVTDTSGNTLAGGETVVRVVLTITGLASGDETVEIRPVASSVYDVGGNAMANTETTGALTLNDSAPMITSGILQPDNSYILVTISEPAYTLSNGTGQLVAGDFQIDFVQNIGGTATAVDIGSVKRPNGSSLQAGDTAIRVNLAITGTPSGVETIEIRPIDGSSIYDAAGNAMANTQTTGLRVLNDAVSPTIIGQSLEAANAYVDITVSEGLYNTNGGAGALQASDFAVTFLQNAGTAFNVTIASVTNNGGGALAGGETVIRVNLTVTGAPDGAETIEIQPTDGSSIYDSAGNAMADTETTGTINLNPWSG